MESGWVVVQDAGGARFPSNTEAKKHVYGFLGAEQADDGTFVRTLYYVEEAGDGAAADAAGATEAPSESETDEHEDDDEPQADHSASDGDVMEAKVVLDQKTAPLGISFDGAAGMISEVVPDSPADKAGVQSGWVVVQDAGGARFPSNTEAKKHVYGFLGAEQADDGTFVRTLYYVVEAGGGADADAGGATKAPSESETDEDEDDDEPQADRSASDGDVMEAKVVLDKKTAPLGISFDGAAGMISEVVPDSPADKAGMQSGWVVVQDAG
eukprot:gene18756-3118_t